MTLLPDSASFHEKVQACFVAFRRRGVSLSSMDVDLLEQWAAHDVPFEVIARGIRKAAEALLWDAVEGDEAPESLRSCRREVEAEIKKYVRETAGRGERSVTPHDDFLTTRHKKLKAAVKKVASPLWLPQLKAPETFEASERQEALVMLLLLRALPFEKRSSLLREARSLVEKAHVISAATFKESLRFHRVALTRQAWSMSSAW